jgi:selenide,water dikinase
VEFQGSIDDYSQMMLFDAQTSGGLLLAIPEVKFSKFMRAARRAALPVWPIGRVEKGEGIRVVNEPFEGAEPTVGAQEMGLFFSKA